jgi:hypothetical protein
MELLPIITVTAIGVVGFCLMLAAFGMVARRGGWQQAMQPDAHGRWPVPRYLMLVGALLGTVFGLLLFLPGLIPWWDYSSPWTTWALGVLFGIGLATIYWQVILARRGHPGGAKPKGQG